MPNTFTPEEEAVFAVARARLAVAELDPALVKLLVRINHGTKRAAHGVPFDVAMRMAEIVDRAVAAWKAGQQQ